MSAVGTRVLEDENASFEAENLRTFCCWNSRGDFVQREEFAGSNAGSEARGGDFRCASRLRFDIHKY